MLSTDVGQLAAEAPSDTGVDEGECRGPHVGERDEPNTDDPLAEALARYALHVDVVGQGYDEDQEEAEGGCVHGAEQVAEDEQGHVVDGSHARRSGQAVNFCSPA